MKPQNLTPIDVLLVDDEPEICQLLSEIVTEQGFSVDTACDGQDALEQLRQREVAAVICDFQMPRMSGIELLTQMRPKGLDIPVVMLTAHGDRQFVLQALRLGAFDFMRKPL
ncbi:response regulator [Bdellovibrionota bacterium FG-1]